MATLDTAGRAVMVAGSTVVISMLGLFAMGLSFMRGAALVTILGVLVVMLASITLFPALLGYLGRHIDRLRLPLLRSRTSRSPIGGHVEPSRGWLAWSRLSTGTGWSRPSSAWLALLAAGRAVPRRPVRLPRRRQQPRGHLHPAGLRPAVATASAPASNGPLLLVAELPTPADRPALDHATGAAALDHWRRRGDRAGQSARTATPRCSPSSRRPDRRTRAPRTWCTGCATPRCPRRPRAPG